MEPSHEPIPARLLDQMRVMTHDLHRLRENVAAGRVRPEHYAAIERAMATRLELLEAAVHRRLLDEAREARGRRVVGMN